MRQSRQRFLCGVSEGCNGSLIHTNKNIARSIKTHSTSFEAFKCKVKYLIRQGYMQIGSKEFVKENGPVLVLTKPSRFGQGFVPSKGDKGSKRIRSKRYIYNV